MLDTQDINKIINPLLEQVRQQSFVKGYEATDAECLGLVVSKFFRWNGYEIGKVAIEAFEDSNFHEIAENLQLNLNEEFNDVRSK